MARKKRMVTPKEVQRMLALYEQCGSYAEVARRTGRNPQTVARHIQGAHPDYVRTQNLQDKTMDLLIEQQLTELEAEKMRERLILELLGRK